jgi:predicted PurR-regulated permease PerM
MANHSEHKQVQPPLDAAVIPVWLKVLLGLAAFVIIVAGMKAAATILVPFLLALFVAIISAPALFWMQQKGVRPAFAILIVTAILLGAGLFVGTVLAKSIPSFIQSLPEYSRRLQENLTTFCAWIQQKGVNIETQQILQYFKPDSAVKMMGDLLSQFGNLMTKGFLIFLTLVFILLEASMFEIKLQNALHNPQQSMQRLARITRDVKLYLAVKTAISLATGIIVTIWLMILGVDYAVIWGLLAFILNFVPSIGSILAAIPPIILALIQLGIGNAVLVAVGYLVVNVALGNFLEPRLVGQKLGLSTLVVFLSLIFWGWVLGPVGMLLSVPLTMAVKIVLQSNDDTRWIAILLGSGPASHREKSEKK